MTQVCPSVHAPRLEPSREVTAAGRFRGARYRAILAAAEANGVPHGPSDDMCALGRDVAAVADACGRRDTMRGLSIGMLAATGVFTATAVALGVVRGRRAKAGRVAVMVDPLQGVVGRF